MLVEASVTCVYGLVMGSLSRHPSYLYRSVRNGELDPQLAEVSNQATPRKPKGKRAV